MKMPIALDNKRCANLTNPHEVLGDNKYQYPYEFEAEFEYHLMEQPLEQTRT